MHGANGQLDDCVDTSTHLAITQRMLDFGWIVASSEMHGNNWGNADALADVIELHDWVTTTYNVTNVVLWGVSMGGLSAWQTLANDSIADVIGAVGCSPVCDLRDMYDNRGFDSQIRTAFGIAGDGSDYAALTAGHDPVLLADTVWTDKRLRMYQSEADTTTPRSEHSAVLAAIAAATATEATAVETTGGHGDASNYPAVALVDWLLSIGAVDNRP